MAGGEEEPRLIPVAVVDAVTGEPLMLAYADEEALRRTAETGYAWFYSRSRREHWLKGAGSGSTLRVLQVLLDCDHDAAAYVAATDRHVCHLGRRSCFHNTLHDARLGVLEELLGETKPHTRVEGERVLHPLTTWRPPPSPLLASLAAWLLAETIRSRAGAGVNALLAPEGPGSMLALLAAQRLRARLHLSTGGGAPESIGEEDRVAVYAPSPREALSLAEAARERSATVAAVVAFAPPGRGVDALFTLEDGGLRPLRRPP